MKFTPEQHKEIERAIWNIEFRDKDIQYDLFDKNKLSYIRVLQRTK